MLTLLALLHLLQVLLGLLHQGGRQLIQSDDAAVLQRHHDAAHALGNLLHVLVELKTTMTTLLSLTHTVIKYTARFSISTRVIVL